MTALSILLAKIKKTASYSLSLSKSFLSSSKASGKTLESVKSITNITP
jgi:hypothetical protein